MKRDEYTRLPNQSCTQPGRTLSEDCQSAKPLHPKQNIPSYTQTDTFRYSNNTAHLCLEIKASPALHPNSPFWTEHLHPTRRYKHRPTRKNLNLHLNLSKTRVETPS